MKELKFIHITKTSGTHICKKALNNNIKWGKNHGEYGERHSFFQDKPIELKIKYDWFLVCRNPYDRCVSEIMWLANIDERSLTKHPFNADKSEITFLDKYKNARKRDLITKEEFSDDIIYCIDLFTKLEPNGGHFSPMYKYLDDSVTVNIVRFENIENDFNSLMKKYDIRFRIRDFRMSHFRRSHRFDTNMLNNKCINRINEFYSKDFDVFDYNRIVL